MLEMVLQVSEVRIPIHIKLKILFAANLDPRDTAILNHTLFVC